MAGYRLFGGGSGGGLGDADIILDNIGTINFDDTETLIWTNFKPDGGNFGNINIDDGGTLFWRNFISPQGNIDYQDDITDLTGSLIISDNGVFEIDKDSAASFSDSWTGSDGNPWESNKWDVSESEITPDINSNRGRMNGLTASGALVGRAEAKSSFHSYAELFTKWRTSSTNTQPRVILHGDGIWQSSGDKSRPLNGYSVVFQIASNIATVSKHLAGTDSSLGTINISTLAAADENAIRWRIYPNGRMFVRIWDFSSTEPTTWDEFLDTTNQITGGILMLSGYNNGGGIQDVIFDDLTLTGEKPLIWQNFKPELGNFGTLDVQGDTTLNWRNFIASSFGTLDVQGDTVLMWHNFIQNQGTLNIQGDTFLKWTNFKPNLGDFGTLDVAGPIRLFHLFQWGERNTNTGFNNPNNVNGRSDNVFADSTTDASDDILDSQAGTITSLTGLTLIPSLTQVTWSYQSNQGGLLALLGEQYRGQFRTLSGGALRTVFNDGDGVLVVPAGEEFGQTRYGGHRMVTDDANVRADIDALAGTDGQNFIDGSLSRFTHIKGIALPQGDLSVDAVAYSMWFRDSNASAPTVTRDLGTSAVPWTVIAGTFDVANNRIQNGSAVTALQAVRDAPVASSDFVWLLRVGFNPRPAAGVSNTEVRFLCPDSADINPSFAIRFTIGTAAANDALAVGRYSDGGAFTQDASVTPTGGWIVQQAVGTTANWFKIYVTNIHDANVNPQISIDWIDSPNNIRRLMTNQTLTRGGAVTNTSGNFGLFIPANAAVTGYLDDMFWIT